MVIRRATKKDVHAIAEVFARARERMSYLPELHTEEEQRELFSDLLSSAELWVAEQEERVIGFVAFDETTLLHLYVHPLAQRFGIGSALLDRAKTERRASLELWVFQKNVDARRFFERRGFELVRVTDGSNNEEQEPDALYAWKPNGAA